MQDPLGRVPSSHRSRRARRVEPLRNGEKVTSVSRADNGSAGDAKAYVYVFRHAYGVKVGITAGTPEDRRAGLERAAGLPIEYVDAFPIESKSRARVVEAWALHELREHQTFGEWHSCDAATATAAVAWALEHAPAEGPGVWAQIQQWQREARERQPEAWARIDRLIAERETRP